MNFWCLIKTQDCFLKGWGEWAVAPRFQFNMKRMLHLYLFHYTMRPSHKYPFISVTLKQGTHKHNSFAIAQTTKRILSNKSQDKNSKTFYITVLFTTLQLTWFMIAFLYVSGVEVWTCSSYQFYLSIIAHMSRLTFSKAPTMPFSTACKSAGWSSTRIACMHPWNERWEGGNGVSRKYPATKRRNKQQQHETLLCTFTLTSHFIRYTVLFRVSLIL